MKLAEIIKTIPGYDPYRNAEGYTFNPKLAQRAIDFFTECITHVKGVLAGRPYILEPHEVAITANLFGWIDKNGNRRFREALYFVARKNSKTTWAAGIALYVLFVDGEPGAECYCGASDKDQATLLFQQAEYMVRACPEMLSRCKIYTAVKSIVYGTSSFKAISSESASKHGYNSHLVIIDELHAQPNRELVDVLETSMGSRTQPLLIYITTADFQRISICNEKYDYACKVRDGIINDPTFLPVIYEATLDDDWKDPEVWKKANPNLGKSVMLDYMKRKCKRASETPAFQNTFMRLHLNIQTETDTRWIPMEAFDANRLETVPLEGQPCFGGLDLSSTKDISSFALWFPHDDGTFSKKLWNWIPSVNAYKKDKQSGADYLLWKKDKFIELTPGNVIDYDRIRAKINEIGEIFNIKCIGADRWNATQIINQLSGDGFDMVPFGQGYASLSAPTKEFEAIILGKKLHNDKNPVFRWALSNVMVEQDAAGNIKCSKAKSTQRIDPIAATVNAVGMYIANIDKPSVYETRGIISI